MTYIFSAGDHDSTVCSHVLSGQPAAEEVTHTYHPDGTVEVEFHMEEATVQARLATYERQPPEVTRPLTPDEVSQLRALISPVR